MQNALSYIPREEMQEEVVAELRSVFNSADRAEAERRLASVVASYAESAPKLSHWMEHNIPEGLSVFCLPLRHRVRMRTSNSIERLNREIKRRTRVASIFPNDNALLRLASAVLMEIDEDWTSGKKYLTM
jgi:transposase-like protein